MFKKRMRLSEQIKDDNPHYIEGLQYEFGRGVKRDYEKALACYEKGMQEGDETSRKKVFYQKFNIPAFLINTFVFIAAFIVGFITNYLWIGLFVTGVSFLITALILNVNYWDKKGFAYQFNLVLLFIAVLIIIPFSAMLPYLNGVTWLPVTAMLVVSFFVVFVGIILYFSDREIVNIWISLAGLFVFALSIFAFAIETPDKKFVIQNVADGVEIIGYRSSDVDVEIPMKLNNKPVVSIAARAFMNTEIKTVTMGDNIKEIKAFAFANTPYLEEVILPKEVLLGRGVFYHAESLKTVVLPELMDSIPDQLLYGAISLREITIPLSVTSIGYGAFAYTPSLYSIDIPIGVAHIGPYAFAGSGILSIDLPDTVTYLGPYAFSDTTQLQSIRLSENIHQLQTGVFKNATGLRSFTIPTQVTSIGDEAFAGASELTEINLHDGITDIGIAAFRYAQKLKHLEIPEGIVRLNNDLCRGCESLVSIDLPSSLKSIADGALSGAKLLKSIDLPEGLIAIGSDAFANNNSLEYIHIPDSVINIGPGAFRGASSLKSLYLPQNVKQIHANLCDGCTALTTVTFAPDIDLIGDYAFRNASMLEVIVIPNTVQTIGLYAFFGASSLREVILNEGLQHIKAYAFYGARSLEAIDIPMSLTRVDDGAFGQCSNLVEIHLHEGIIHMGHYAFYGCTSLTIHFDGQSIPSTWVSSWNPNQRPIQFS